MVKVVSPRKTWKLKVVNDQVVDCDEFATFQGMTLSRLETFCMSRGWILRKN